jgi:hypothetical protein
LLAALLGSERFYGQIETKVSGATGRRRLEPEDLLECDIPSPERDAQEELIASIDRNRRIITAADELIANWSIDTAELNWSNQVPLSDCLDFVSSGSTPLGGDANYVEAGVLFIRSQNILKGECEFSDAVFIPPEIHASMGRTAVHLNDVFLNITGASIGRSAVMEIEREANVNQHVAILRPNAKLLDPHYLCFVLNTSRLQQAINTAQMGASRQGLNFTHIRELRVPMCSLEAQRKIGTKLREMNSVRRAIRDIASQSRGNAAQMLEQIWES